MTHQHCPYCGFLKAWNIRRYARKCKKCRREWTPSREVISGIRANVSDWRIFLKSMIRYRTVASIKLHTQISHPVILKMYSYVRVVMAVDVPPTLSGVVEVDETYIGAQWRNRKWKVRKTGTKKGRGTFKLAVFGMCERERGVVRAFIVPDVKKKTLMVLMKKHIEIGSTIYSDAYQLYQETVKEGYLHDFVDHKQNEYGRGPVHSNTMEGFWGILKRRLKTTGGIRESRLQVYLAEEVWRYNNRKISEAEKIEKLLTLLKRIGG